MTAFLLAVLLASVGIQGMAGARHKAMADDEPATAPTEAQAVLEARRSGEPVEALNRRSETEQVFAQPDGTFSFESSVLPERVQQEDGSWVPIDTTLRRTSNGQVAPVASSLDVRLSGGGDAAMARIDQHGKSLAIDWPGKLPKPELDGSTATYRSVFPDVDLKITVSALGWSEVLVVKTPQAAANPALGRLDFALRAEGLSVRKNASGGFDAVGPGGVRVFQSSPPRMWDSSGQGRTVTPDPVKGAMGESPKPGGRQALMALEAASTKVSVIPDRAMLTDPAVKFPLYIDPDVTPVFTKGKSAWTMVDHAYQSSTSYWNSSHTPEVGYYGQSGQDGKGVKRVFFRINSAFGKGKNVLDASFYITQNKSWGCDSSPQAVHLYWTGAISKTTSWNHQPKWLDYLDSEASDGGYNASCPAKGLKFNVKSLMVKSGGTWPSTTFGLKDYDDMDSSTWGWKGFANAPKLVVHYNTKPATPAAYGTYPGTKCVTGSGRPVVNADGSAASPMKLNATIYDPDKTQDLVRGEFQLHHFNPATGSWDDITNKLPASADMGVHGATNFGSWSKPTPLSIMLPPMGNGNSYAWHVRAYDGTDASAYTPWCEFTVDTYDPQLAPQVDSPMYPDDDPTSIDDYHGGVGLADTFTFRPGTGETDVVGYRWALDDPNKATAATQVNAPAPGQPVSVQIAPPRFLQNVLYVYPVDRAGNVGVRRAEYTFYVKSGADPVAQWQLNETAGTNAADSSVVGSNPATLNGGAIWSANGRTGGALHLDGTSGHATSVAPAVPTDKGLSVGAWVRLTGTAHNSTVVSQSGDTTSGFVLYYSKTADRWAFNMQQTDVQNPVIDRVTSDQPPTLGVWTHLLGVYDAPNRMLRLYVNGILQATSAHDVGWNARGSVQIGREKYQGTQQNYFVGDLDEVKIWNRILSDDGSTVRTPDLTSEIGVLAKQPPVQQGWWKLDEAAGTSSKDDSGFEHPLTLAAGAGWGDDGVAGYDLTFSGSATSFASTSAPALRTDQSFAVSVWVKLPDTVESEACTLPEHTLTAVSQAGTNHSGFYIGYRRFVENGVPVPRWSFSMPGFDADTGTFTYGNSAEPIECESASNSVTHLVGVYDQQQHQIRLYVNGMKADDRPFTATWNAGGALRLGAGKYKGNLVDFWQGEIDEVQVFSGTLTDEQVTNLSQGIPATG